jgi:putative phosphoesterase
LKILVLSDSHGDWTSFLRVLRKNPEIKTIVFLGDGLHDLREVKKHKEAFDRAFLAVKGNCDFGSPFPNDGTFDLEGITVFYTHGHNYGVKLGLTLLRKTALSQNAALVLFGHTHEPYAGCLSDPAVADNPLFALNPGSVSSHYGGNSYGIVSLENGNITAEIKFLSEE